MQEMRFWECPECRRLVSYLQRKCDCGHAANGSEPQYKTCPNCGCVLPTSRTVCDCGEVLIQRRHLADRICKHFIRPVYETVDDAPMKFYKFTAHFSCIIGIFLNFFTALKASILIGTLDPAIKWLGIVDALYVWIGLFLLCAATINLNQMEWLGVRFYLCFDGYQILYNACFIGYSCYLGLYNSDTLAKPIASVLVLSVYMYACAIYFGKRRLLFTPYPTINGKAPKTPKMAAHPIFTPQPEPAPIVCTYQSDFEIKEPPAPSVAAETQTETPVAKKHAGKPLKWPVVALAVLLAVSIAGNVYQAVDATNNQREVSELQSELEKQKRAVTTLRTGKDQLAKQVQSLKDEIAELEDYNDFATEYAIAGLFMYDSIGFIVQGSRYYHRYDCPVFQDADSYWAHNIEYCAGQGYSRHSACWED